MIPDFIVTYFEDKYWLVGLIIFILAQLMFYLSVRLMSALPPDFFERRSVKEAISYSLKNEKALLVLYLELILDCRQTYLFFILY